MCPSVKRACQSPESLVARSIDHEFKHSSSYVSQIDNFTDFPSTRMIFTLKSTPTVDDCDVLNRSSQYLSRRLDFPVPGSPIITIFKR